MGKIKDRITSKQQDFIKKQHMFFVATAPDEEHGRINLSPKGLDCFRVLSANKVAYLDMTGSGNETAAHIAQNGRITFMFCGFEGAPNILRLYGHAKVLLPGSSEWDELIDQFELLPGARQIFHAEITGTQDSCGFGIPVYSHVEGRTQLTTWANTMGPEKLEAYRAEKNKRSIDGLPAPGH
ncbi:MAG: pyridoxamine 5'-phosphate oxidase family protein [Rhodothermales bacterium]